MGINLNEKGYASVKAATPGEFNPLPADGYICNIYIAEMVKSKSNRDMLNLYVDIADGQFAGYFKNATERRRRFDSSVKWDSSGIYRQLIFDESGKIAPFFKGLMSCIELSNPTFKLNLNNFEPNSLTSLQCGFVFGEEEYSKKNGDIGTKVVPKTPKTVDDIRCGNFKVPNKKTLAPPPPKSDIPDDLGGTPIDPNDTPF